MTSKDVSSRLEQRAKKSLKDFRKACAQVEKLLESLNRRMIALLVHGRPHPETLDTADHLAQQLQNVMESVDQLREHFGVARSKPSQQVAQHMVQNMAPAPAPAPTAPAAPSPRAAQALLRGSNKCLPVATVLELLSTQGKSGSLRVSTEEENFTLDLVDGDIVHTATDRPSADLLLGNILVERGAVTQEDLDDFLARMGQSTEKIGDALQREELATVHDLQAALEQQVQARFNRIFTAEQATYYFYEQQLTPTDDHIRMNVTQLLLESARCSDEGQLAEPEPMWGGDQPSWGGDPAPPPPQPSPQPDDPMGGWGSSPT